MPRQFGRLAHSVYECNYHMVFCSQHRHRVLQDGVVEYTKHQNYRLCEQKVVCVRVVDIYHPQELMHPTPYPTCAI
jgi:REP element-mobilizing transposase RayT